MFLKNLEIMSNRRDFECRVKRVIALVHLVTMIFKGRKLNSSKLSNQSSRFCNTLIVFDTKISLQKKQSCVCETNTYNCNFNLHKKAFFLFSKHIRKVVGKV